MTESRYPAMTIPDTITAESAPYGTASADYLAAGWAGVLPLPPKAKHAPPTGYTGQSGAFPSVAEIEAWRAARADGNIALRLPTDVIGLDVDDYAGKAGAVTLAAAEARWGTLPATVMSTSRTQGVSGIRLYRVPTGMSWPNVAGEGIDVIRYGHRYAVVAPSVHPEGREYVWRTSSGAPATMPSPEELPALPAAWIEGLTAGTTETVTARADLDADAARAFIDAFPRGAACLGVGRYLDPALVAFTGTDGSSRYAAMTAVQGQLVRLGANGCPGAAEALSAAHDAYTGALAGVRDAGSEWNRALVGAVRLVAADPVTELGCTHDLGAFDSWLTKVMAPRPAGAVIGEEVWDERASLRHVRDWARARRASPWAALGVVLTRVVTATPPNIVLPALIGGEASLNMFVALVGPSGNGKGSVERCAEAALDIGDVDVAGVGSGEGIAHLYARREKGVLVRERDAVLFTVAEVDNLTALGARQGATLMPQLRSAWSGERLGFAYADAAKSLPLEAHSYRMCLVLGVQPEKAAPLMDDAGGGTPQRFLWLPTLDPGAPDEAPPAPERGTWARPRFAPAHLSAPRSMTVPEVAARAIDAGRLARLRGEGAALDGHAGLARLKLAAALALLEGRLVIDDDDWRVAGMIMAVSDDTRAGVVRELAHRASAANTARAKFEGARAVVVEAEVNGSKVTRVAQVIERGLGRESGWATHRDVMRAVASRDRRYADDALDALVAAGVIDTLVTEDKTTYRLRERR
jgi:hypothetical protein